MIHFIHLQSHLMCWNVHELILEEEEEVFICHTVQHGAVSIHLADAWHNISKYQLIMSSSCAHNVVTSLYVMIMSLFFAPTSVRFSLVHFELVRSYFIVCSNSTLMSHLLIVPVSSSPDNLTVELMSPSSEHSLKSVCKSKQGSSA